MLMLKWLTKADGVTFGQALDEGVETKLGVNRRIQHCGSENLLALR